MNGDPLLITMSDLGVGSPSSPGKGGGLAGQATSEMVIENLQDISLASQKASDENQRWYVIRQIADFSAMGRAFDRIAGRKEVILLSEGFDSKMLQGRRSSPV